MANLVDAIGSWGRKIERRRQNERDLRERAVLAAEREALAKERIAAAVEAQAAARASND